MDIGDVICLMAASSVAIKDEISDCSSFPISIFLWIIGSIPCGEIFLETGPNPLRKENFRACWRLRPCSLPVGTSL